LTILKLFAV
jgi:hypothetical protein